jgi:hypothetical protein
MKDFNFFRVRSNGDIAAGDKRMAGIGKAEVAVENRLRELEA